MGREFRRKNDPYRNESMNVTIILLRGRIFGETFPEAKDLLINIYNTINIIAEEEQ